MKKLEYTVGDATQPVGEGNKIIVHVCNDIGAWGAGFVLALSKRWKLPENESRAWHKSMIGFELGEVQFVQVEEMLWVANLIGQHRIRRDENGNPPIRYEAIQKGMESIRQKALELNASLHMPRIGCGLAGGKWESIEPILEDKLSKHGLQVTVYDFRG